MTFKQDDEVTPVLFRIDREHGTDYLTAVFPCDPAEYTGVSMSCYAHVGQHSACCLEWYRETRPARPEEYEDLKRELEGTPYGYRLKVYSRIQPWMRDRHRETQRGFARGAA